MVAPICCDVVVPTCLVGVGSCDVGVIGVVVCVICVIFVICVVGGVVCFGVVFSKGAVVLRDVGVSVAFVVIMLEVSVCVTIDVGIVAVNFVVVVVVVLANVVDIIFVCTTADVESNGVIFRVCTVCDSGLVDCVVNVDNCILVISVELIDTVLFV